MSNTDWYVGGDKPVWPAFKAYYKLVNDTVGYAQSEKHEPSPEPLQDEFAASVKAMLAAPKPQPSKWGTGYCVGVPTKFPERLMRRAKSNSLMVEFKLRQAKPLGWTLKKAECRKNQSAAK